MPDPFIPRGGEIRVNDVTALTQSDPVIAALPGGGFVTVWESNGLDGNSFGIIMQRFDASGAPFGAQAVVNTITLNGQVDPGITVLTNGGWVIVWDGYDISYQGVFGQIFAPDGTPVGGEFQVNTTTAEGQKDAEIVALSDGGFLVVWESDLIPVGEETVNAQRFDAMGQPVGVQQTLGNATPNDQDNPDVAALTGGGAVVVWQAGNFAIGDDDAIVGQLLTPEGTPSGPVFTIAPTNLDATSAIPRVASLTDGGFIVTWETFDLATNSLNVFAQRYDSDGTAVGGTFQVNTFTTSHQGDPDVIGLPDGGWVITWESDPAQDGSFEGVFAQRYDAAGQPVGMETQINTFTTDSQRDPRLAVQSDGSFVITWESRLQDGDNLGVYQQIFDGHMIGTAGADVLIDTPGTNLLSGQAGNDTITGGSGNDAISGGDDVDTAVFGGNRGAAQIAVVGGIVTVTTATGGTDTLTEVEFLQFDDMTVSVASLGQSGMLIEGDEFANNLVGGENNDTIRGFAGTDRLDGGAGNDIMEGGLGNDRYIVDSAGDVIQGEIGFSLGGGIDTVESWVSFTLTSNLEILRLQGTADINGTGGFAPEAIVGQAGNNVLDGGGGYDVITAKDGDDTLIGGLGADSLVGDGGADVFDFNNVNESRPGQANRDFINGFVRGEDRIDLSGIDANTLTGADDAFSFIGNAAFTGTAGELRYFTFGGGNFNIVEADVNGDGIADMQIFVNLTNFMTGTDFIF